MLYIPYNSKQIRTAYVSKHNFVKSLFVLFRGITSKNVGNFYCLTCFHSYATENKLKQHKNVCKNHDYCYVEMLKKDNEILKYNP